MFFANYQHFSDGDGGSWGFSLPFYQTSAPWSLGTDGGAARARVLRFRDGKHVSFNLVFDRLAMLEQLGLVPEPAS